MRVRKYHRNSGVPPVDGPVTTLRTNIEKSTIDKAPAVTPIKQSSSKATSSRGPAALFRKIMQNPNLNLQLVVILLTLTSENFSMDRRIDSMSTTVDKIRNMTDVINNTMKSVKVASEAPKQIRSLFNRPN